MDLSTNSLAAALSHMYYCSSLAVSARSPYWFMPELPYLLYGPLSQHGARRPPRYSSDPRHLPQGDERRSTATAHDRYSR